MISDERMKGIINVMHRETYQKGKLIIQKGDELDDLIMIESGEVIVKQEPMRQSSTTQFSQDNFKYINKYVCVVGTGQSLGETEILQNNRFQYYAYCQT